MVGSYDNLMYCFDALSGKLQWTYETEYFINGSPATDGKNIIFDPSLKTILFIFVFIYKNNMLSYANPLTVFLALRK